METLKYLIDLFEKNDRVFYLLVLFLFFLFLLYLFMALYMHTKDRRALERMAVKEGAAVFFKYSWKGVEFRIRPARDNPANSKMSPTPENGPPAAPRP